MNVTDEDLKAFPPPEHLIEIVKDAAGSGKSESGQREARQTLAVLFYPHFQRLVRRRDAYKHIGGHHELEDDLQRLCGYIFLGLREDSKGDLKENKHPLLTWLENMEDPKKARDLKHYVLFVANRYLRHDLRRNVRRGRGKERPVTWYDETENNDGDLVGAYAEKERQIQFLARQLADLETLSEEEKLLLRDCVRRCLDLIPQEEREALLTKFYHGSSQAEYAMEVGVSEATMHRRIKNGVQKFQTLLHSMDPGLLRKQDVGKGQSQKTSRGKEL